MAQGISLKELADKMGVGTQQAVKLVTKAVKIKACQNLIQKDGIKNLYPPKMVEQIMQARKDGKLGIPRTASKSVSKNTELVVTVHINDSDLAEILKHQFGNSQGISSHLKSYLENNAKSLKQKIQKIKEEAEKAQKQLLQASKFAER